jgi:prophage regulatory protein
MTSAVAEKGRILRRRQVEAETGLPKSTIYARMKTGTFPRPVPLDDEPKSRAVGWLEAEIIAWKNARIAAREGRGTRRSRRAS